MSTPATIPHVIKSAVRDALQSWLAHSAQPSMVLPSFLPGRGHAVAATRYAMLVVPAEGAARNSLPTAYTSAARLANDLLAFVPTNAARFRRFHLTAWLKANPGYVRVGESAVSGALLRQALLDAPDADRLDLSTMVTVGKKGIDERRTVHALVVDGGEWRMLVMPIAMPDGQNVPRLTPELIHA